MMNILTQEEFDALKERAGDALRLHWQNTMKAHLRGADLPEGYECSFQFHLAQEALKEGVKRVVDMDAATANPYAHRIM